MNKEELVKQYDEMKLTAFVEYEKAVAELTLKYRKEKEAMKEWYDKRKAEL